MSIFISYSHQDSEVVEKIAAGLANRNTHIWLDKWELNFGDSLIEVIQEALTDSSALLIMLSKKSVESEWCKKEVNSALLRELEEKRVVAIPVLLEDCEIPIFLRGKYYADFRGNFNVALNKLSASLSKFTDISMGRTEVVNHSTDWALDLGEYDSKFMLRVDSVNTYPDKEYTFVCNYLIFTSIEFGLIEDLDKMANKVLEVIDQSESLEDWRYLVEDSRPNVVNKSITSPSFTIDIQIEFRWLGNNDGFDKLYNYGEVLKHMLEKRESVFK